MAWPIMFYHASYDRIFICISDTTILYRQPSQDSIPKVMTNMFQYHDGELKNNYPATTIYPSVIILIVSRFAEGKDKKSHFCLPCGQQTNLSHEGHQFIIQDWKGLQPLFDWNETLHCCRNEMPVRTLKKILLWSKHITIVLTRTKKKTHYCATECLLTISEYKFSVMACCCCHTHHFTTF